MLLGNDKHEEPLTLRPEFVLEKSPAGLPSSIYFFGDKRTLAVLGGRNIAGTEAYQNTTRMGLPRLS
jgi:hypothetical protein